MYISFVTFGALKRKIFFVIIIILVVNVFNAKFTRNIVSVRECFLCVRVHLLEFLKNFIISDFCNNHHCNALFNIHSNSDVFLSIFSILRTALELIQVQNAFSTQQTNKTKKSNLNFLTSFAKFSVVIIVFLFYILFCLSFFNFCLLFGTAAVAINM